MVETSEFAAWCFSDNGVSDVFNVGAFVSPVEFAQSLSFAHDVSARQDKIDLSLTPYLTPILESCDFKGKGHVEITIMAPEQTGKSLTWQVATLWSFVHAPCLSLIIYPSDDKAAEVNRGKLQPLMRSVPVLNAELDLPKTKARNRYNFSSFISYFQGAGERISAHPAQVRIADELDDWIENEGRADKLEDLRKRGRTFNDALLLKVSSPRSSDSAISAEFERSSKGYWYLRCQKCNELSIRSCDIHCLQFESVERGDDWAVVPGSERLKCPNCGHEHTEDSKREMNLQGAFIHEVPERTNNLGFQWGALASQWASLSWGEIASAQLRAGKTARVQEQIYFDNSIRGLPFRPRRRRDEESQLTRRCNPLPEGVELTLFAGADVQDESIWYCVRGMDAKGNSWPVKHGQLKSLDELAEATAEVRNGIIDTMGHRTKEVTEWLKHNQKWIGYKGTPYQTVKPWQQSKESKRLILASAKYYQEQLLYYAYSAEPSEKGNWYILPDMSPEYLVQFCSMKPDKKTRDGNMYRNWKGDGNDHLFDCEKMILVLFEMWEKHKKLKDKKQHGSTLSASS